MSSKTLISLVLSGNGEGVRTYLANHDESPIVMDFEPYALIQRKTQADALRVVLDDPRFVFDDLFVGRMFYFSTSLIRRTLWNHPRMKTLLAGGLTMSDYFHRAYPRPTWTQSAGIGQRYFHADTAIRSLRKEDTNKRNQRLVFILYPSLVKFTRSWIQKHYAPGAKGFLRTQNHFATLASAHT